MKKREFTDILHLLQSLENINDFIKGLDDINTKIRNIEGEVNQIRGLITDYNSSQFLDNWIPLELACQKLGISKRTFYNLRAEGKITFVQPTPKRIFIERAEIKRFLDEHKVERFSSNL